MKNTSLRYQNGIALIQVLLLSAILMVMMLSVNKEARLQVQSAALAKERAHATMQLNSLEAELTFTLLTERRRKQAESANLIVRHWNFFNSPFEVNNATIAIEDVASMLSLTNSSTLEVLVAQITADEQKAQQLVAALQDWQDIDSETTFNGAEQADYPSVAIRNGPMQTESEIRFLHQIDQALYCALKPHLTVAPRRYTNYFLMPSERQKYFVNPDNVDQITKERLAEQLSNDRFEILSGIPLGDFQNYSASNTLRLSFTVTLNSVKLSRLLTLSINPNDAEPVKVWDYYKYYYADHENCR